MNKPQKRVALLLLVLLMITGGFLCFGCATHKKTTDDNLVVSAENTALVARNTVDNFLKVERDNEVWIKANFPQAHAFANSLRDTFPAEFRLFREATVRYKKDRSAENASDVERLSGNMRVLAEAAQQFLTDYNKLRS